MKTARINKYAVGKKLSTTGGALTPMNESLALLKFQALYPIVIGSLAQVQAGVATHDDPQAALDQAGEDTAVLWLPGSYAGSYSVNVNGLNIVGAGRGAQIVAAITFNCNYSKVVGVRVGADITFAVGSNGNWIDCWQASVGIITDNGSANDYRVVVET
jgi:hypothetical protein